MNRSPRAVNLSGRCFGRLKVVERVGRDRWNSATWRCVCECGKTTTVPSHSLVSKNTRSCGCLGAETRKSNGNISNLKHGQSRFRNPTTEYKIFHNAKSRAKQEGLPFDITLEDIKIPAVCPVLGITLQRNRGIPNANSPTLDRFIPEKGYIKGNLAIISYKANTIKNDASLEELKRITAWVEQCHATGSAL